MSSSAMNGMITAIQKINSQASAELIRTFKKGAFNLRPPVTKYHKIWDPDVLLICLESMDTAIKYENCKSHSAIFRTSA